MVLGTRRINNENGVGSISLEDLPYHRDNVDKWESIAYPKGMNYENINNSL